jgi:thiol-disulfide isomerase/thioredoxin
MARTATGLGLAALTRSEHARRPFSNASLVAADAILALGTAYSLESLRGRVVLLNFWATWCLPCRAEMPDIEALHRRFERRGLVILAVSFEVGFLGHFTFPVLLDPERKAMDAFAVDNACRADFRFANGTAVSRDRIDADLLSLVGCFPRASILIFRRIVCRHFSKRSNAYWT